MIIIIKMQLKYSLKANNKAASEHFLSDPLSYKWMTIEPAKFEKLMQ